LRIVEFIALICDEYTLQSKTVGVAVHYFDRAMARVPASDYLSELDALACLLLASKFLETRVPALGELRSIGDREYTREEFKEAELRVLHNLDWRLHATTPHAFLEQMVTAFDVNSPCRVRSTFFIDMSYYDAAILEYTPIVVAAGALLFSWEQLGHSDQSVAHGPALVALCGVNEATLSRCKDTLIAYFEAELQEPPPRKTARGRCATPLHPLKEREEMRSPLNVESSYDHMFNSSSHHFSPVRTDELSARQSRPTTPGP
jgi:hypothetical protein